MLGALEFGQKGALPGARRGVFGAQAYAIIDSEVMSVIMVVLHCPAQQPVFRGTSRRRNLPVEKQHHK